MYTSQQARGLAPSKPETKMSKKEYREVGDRNNRAAAAMRKQGDMESAERYMAAAEYYWNLAAGQPREE
jgi:mannose-1-phosphate guanylyltransferase